MQIKNWVILYNYYMKIAIDSLIYARRLIYEIKTEKYYRNISEDVNKDSTQVTTDHFQRIKSYFIG